MKEFFVYFASALISIGVVKILIASGLSIIRKRKEKKCQKLKKQE